MSVLQNINSAYSLVQSLYGIDPDPNDFEDVAMTAWGLIGNKHTRLYRYVSNTHNGELILPCNVHHVESVRIPGVDYQETSNKESYGNLNAAYVESYIDSWHREENPFNEKGRLVKYTEGDGILYFNRDYQNVSVIYHGFLADDEDGLPLVSEKEARAIAAYVAYKEMYKDGIRKRNKDSLTLSQYLKEDWLRHCSAARIPEHLSQNDVNTILDAKYSWDRKQYGKSIKLG